ncbi:MAG: hypothetical protein ABR880_12710 [Candidatus Sulfotelmatobacter sp.]|jgi:hypothetical protein
MNRVREMLRDFLATAVATLREIFDEAAYARFLSRAGMASSSESYAEFRREFEEAKVRRPKCC